MNMSLALQALKVIFLLFLTFGTAEVALADPIDDSEDVPATADEIQFINRVIDQVKSAVPPLDGWKQEVAVRASGNMVKKDREVLIYERARNYPLKISIHFKFHLITAAESDRTAMEKQTILSIQELQQQMMEAAMSGDRAKMEQLQQQMSETMRMQMEAGAMGQAVGVTPMPPAEKKTEFHVQVTINGDGAKIGKQYDTSAPGVSHASRIDNNKKNYRGYKYYLGGWEVSEADRKNWRIVFPKQVQTADNHLRALVVYANVYGDRKSVEDYVKSSLDLNGLASLRD